MSRRWSRDRRKSGESAAVHRQLEEGQRSCDGFTTQKKPRKLETLLELKNFSKRKSLFWKRFYFRRDGKLRGHILKTGWNAHKIWILKTGAITFRNEKVVYKDKKEAYDAYCTYAQNNGFIVRNDHHSYWLNSRKIKSKEFICSKVGFKRQYDLNFQKRCRRFETRKGCPSLIRFVVDEARNWTVKKFIETHNHELARVENRHLLRSCRNIDDDKASVLKSMTEAGIRTVDVFSYLAKEVGGVENLEFIKMDVYNFIQKERRAKIEFGANGIYEKEISEENDVEIAGEFY
ncbi:hypothetical protein M5K25_006242 [Dendrobium thyrsiflorum]|uniref:FAR1 domain-containing protein n=1 Tax=Dendrobium thyrsiflorum TaxID=117978 RepID=A0ABD0VB24_DENTH